MLVVAACGEGTEPTARPPATEGATSTATAGAPSETPTEEPVPTEVVVPSDEPVPTETPVPSDPVPSAEPTPTDGSGSAAACAGNDENRVFYANVAAAVDWPVYCPVLPAGWFVERGEYKSAGGGWMTIAYKGPSGARIEIGEGFFCSDADGCVPDGPDVGPARFGGLDGTLVMGSDGRNAVVVDRGSSPSWVATGSGLDVEVFTDLVADFSLVEG